MFVISSPHVIKVEWLRVFEPNFDHSQKAVHSKVLLCFLLRWIHDVKLFLESSPDSKFCIISITYHFLPPFTCKPLVLIVCLTCGRIQESINSSNFEPLLQISRNRRNQIRKLAVSTLGNIERNEHVRSELQISTNMITPKAKEFREIIWDIMP